MIGADLEMDGCDCPACEPPCRKAGKPCFIKCERCANCPESDDFGPLKSKTERK